MDFQQCKAEWERLIQQKQSNMPFQQSLLCLQHLCKICQTIEILKHSVCQSNCLIEQPQDKQIIIAKLLSLIEPDNPQNIFLDSVRQEFQRHEIQEDCIKQATERLSALEKELDVIKNMQNSVNYEVQELRRSVQEESAPKPQEINFQDLMQRLVVLESNQKIQAEQAQQKLLLDNVQQSLEEHSQNLNQFQIEENQNLRDIKENLVSLVQNIEQLQRQNSETSSRISEIVKKSEEEALQRSPKSDVIQRLNKLELDQQQISKSIDEKLLSQSQQSEESQQMKQSQPEQTIQTQGVLILDSHTQAQTLIKQQVSYLQNEIEGIKELLQSIQVNNQTQFQQDPSILQNFKQYENEILKLRDEMQNAKETLQVQEENKDEVYEQTQEFQNEVKYYNKTDFDSLQPIEEVNEDEQEEKIQQYSLDQKYQTSGSIKKEEKLFHPGKWKYDINLKRSCWSCCQTNKQCLGCKKV